MPTVTFKKNRLLKQDVTVEAKVGQTLLDLAQQHGFPMGSNCGGVCGCSTCHSYVVRGFDSLEEMSDKEADRLDRAFDVRLASRLGCQAEVGDQDLVVEITEESLKAFLDEHPAIRKRVEATGEFIPEPEKH
jgi:2Fe-2S ferredoxin